MRHSLYCTAFALFFSLSVFAEYREFDLEQALKKGEFDQAEKIFQQWIGSRDLYEQSLVQKWLLYQGDNYQKTPAFPEKAKLVDRILQSGKTQFLPAALICWSQNPSNFTALTPKLKEAAKTVRTQFIQGPRNPESREFFDSSGKFQLPSIHVDRNGTTLSIQAPEEFALAKALHEAGVLGDISRLNYANSATALSGGLLSEQLDLDKASDWIIQNKKTELFPALFAMRKGLNRKTVPSRSDLTQKILKAVRGADPEVSQKLVETAKRSLTADEVDVAVINTQAAQRNPQSVPKYKTLAISLQDGGDVQIANELLSRGQLDDIQVVRHTDKGEEVPRGEKPGYRPPNFPDRNYVHDKDGERLADLIAPENYRSRVDTSSQRGSTPLPDNAPIARENGLLWQATRFSTQTFKGAPALCRFRELAGSH